jgi:HAE1 family hydrophobic/amphiphilic exporter-1
MARVPQAEAFGDVIVSTKTGTPIRVRDLGGVVDGTEEARTISRFNGENAVSLLVRKQSGTNTVKVVEAVKARLTQIGDLHPITDGPRPVAVHPPLL